MAARIGRWLGAIALAGAVVGALGALAPFIPVPASWLLASAILAFVLVGAEVLAASAATPRLPPRALPMLLVPVAILAGVAVAGSALPSLAAAVLVTVGLLGVGTLVGGVVGALIDKPGYLLVVAIVSSIVDVFSVLHPSGPTAQLVQIEAAVNVLILPFPILGTARIEPILGVGDVAFAALYCVAARRHDLGVKRTVVALFVGLLVTMLVVIGAGVGIPALPFLGLAMIVAHPRARALPREDRVKAAVGVAVIALALLALVIARS